MLLLFLFLSPSSFSSAADDSFLFLCCSFVSFFCWYLSALLFSFSLFCFSSLLVPFPFSFAFLFSSLLFLLLLLLLFPFHLSSLGTCAPCFGVFPTSGMITYARRIFTNPGAFRNSIVFTNPTEGNSTKEIL